MNCDQRIHSLLRLLASSYFIGMLPFQALGRSPGATPAPIPSQHGLPVLKIRVSSDLPGDSARGIVRVFARQVHQRCAAEVIAQGDAPLRIELALASGIGTEGFRISDGPDGTIRIIGNDRRGLIYGMGKFLHDSRYTTAGFQSGTWRGTSVPTCPLRGIYLATHFGNFYEAASVEEVREYVEDLSLWGVNSLVVHFPHWQYDGFDDPAARQMLDRLKGILRSAKSAGMKVGLLEAANQAFKSVPQALWNTPIPDPLVRHGNFGVNLCPAKPEAHAVLLRDWQRLLDEFADVGLDYIGYWPYDEGGCGCTNCRPWGACGYPKLCRELSGATRTHYAQIRFILSTWTFDTPPEGEWDGLTKFMARDPSWADYIMADAHEDFPRYPLEKGVPGALPLLNFPEISMWGQAPWGGYGANPLPGRLQSLWNQTEKKLSGGFPYSEGIYEDLNKVVCSQLYWDPNRAAEDSVKAYIAFEFSPEVVTEVGAAIQILEQNHHRDHIGATAAEADELLQKSEEKLTPQARRAWRWRILRLRALIDREMFDRKGRLEGGVLRGAFEELTHLYHAEAAHSMPIHPPQVRLGDTEPK